MFNDLNALRLACQQDEAWLHRAMQDLAALCAPPYTRGGRARIAAAVLHLRPVLMRLQRNWSLHLMQPAMQALSVIDPQRQYFMAVKRHVDLAEEALSQLAQVVRQGPRPLFPPPPNRGSAEAQQLAAHERLWVRVHQQVSPEPPRLYQDTKDHYGDIAYSTTAFFAHMQAARRLALALDKPAPAFLDVGCGIGVKVLQATEFFAQADGLEYEAAHARGARALLQRAGCASSRIFHADALTFADYGRYDVIYAFKPMFNEPLQAMEWRIVEQARPGTILVMPYMEFSSRFEDLGCARLHGYIYLTGHAGRRVDAVLRRAGQVGFQLPAEPKGGYPEDGFVAPLHAALRAWGHAV